ncbi:MAG: Txe/YoeB family addiction module toxin [Olsenella sp.]|nr:Txe/YoeB family addiction module toxin [Olsenella sp.]
MNKVFSDESWADYLWWQSQDRKTLKRVNALIKSIERDDVTSGIGKPEALRGEFTGLWSRRIDEKNRLVYRVAGPHGENLEIVSCRSHYGDH